MKKRIALFILLFTLSVSTTASAEKQVYNNGVIELKYEDSVLNITASDSIILNMISEPDYGDGHNTVIGCLSEENTFFDSLSEISEPEIEEFMKTFTKQMCEGLFDIDDGISVVTNGYTCTDNECEYFMILSDGTECYVKELNYGPTVYYAICRLCPYSIAYNDDIRSAYNTIRYIDDSVSTSQNEEIQQKTEQPQEIETGAETDNTDEPSTETVSVNASDIVQFTDTDPFLQDDNYHTVYDLYTNLEFDKLTASLEAHLKQYGDDSDKTIQTIIAGIQERPDIRSLTIDVDSFDNKKTIYYPTNAEINETTFVYPYADGATYRLRLGFQKDGWLFMDNIALKKDGDSITDGIWFRGDSWDYVRDIIRGGIIEEYKEEWLYDSDTEYLASIQDNDPVTMRFKNEKNDEHFDYTLTENDKRALRSVAEYTTLLEYIQDFHIHKK